MTAFAGANFQDFLISRLRKKSAPRKKYALFRFFRHRGHLLKFLQTRTKHTILVHFSCFKLGIIKLHRYLRPSDPFRTKNEHHLVDCEASKDASAYLKRSRLLRHCHPYFRSFVVREVDEPLENPSKWRFLWPHFAIVDIEYGLESASYFPVRIRCDLT